MKMDKSIVKYFRYGGAELGDLNKDMNNLLLER